MRLMFSTDTDSGTITVINFESDDFPVLAKIEVGNGPRGAVRFTKSGRGFVTKERLKNLRLLA